MASLAQHVMTDRARLLPQQREIILSRADYTIFHGGRGFGKTRAGLWNVFLRARAKSGQRILIGAQTYQQTRDVIISPWQEEFHPDYYTYHSSKNEITVYSIDGGESKILIRSLENQVKIEKVKGITLTGYYLAQAEQLPVEVYNMLEACLRDSSNEHLWFRVFDSNAGSKSHWIHRHFIDVEGAEYLGGDDASVCAVHAKSSDNPFAFTEKQLKTARKTLGDKLFRLEYEGEWGIAEGSIYTIIDGVHVRDDCFSGGGRWILSMDHGSHFYAMLAYHSGPHSHVVDERLVIDGTRKDQLEACRDMLSKNKVTELSGMVGDIAGRYTFNNGRSKSANRWLASKLETTLYRTKKARREGWRHLATLLNDDSHGDRPRLTMSTKCVHLKASLCAAEWDPDQIDTKPFYDHPADTARYYAMSSGLDPIEEDDE